MKYYDGMGKDVTDYIVDLEHRVAELEAKQGKIVAESTHATVTVENVEIVEDVPKPRKRSRS